MDRFFIVSRQNVTVFIREVRKGSCAYTMSRREAWDHAQKLAKPAKKARVASRRSQADIVFIDLSGEQKIVSAQGVLTA